ncbi:MAG: hydrogenase maturation nickel metallochaperone HypA [Thermoplasmata archaeon]|nr:MAG: hydrogenase maturation nickel metallochaperone HypA [Thermoplasmata archaeon]
MHEFSMMMDIVEAALKSIENYDVENVEKVYLDVGELTFLNPEQLKFSFNVLTQENILKGAELVIGVKKTEVECTSCGFRGSLENKPEENHFRIPQISCPKCNGKVNLLSGRECILRNIHMNLKEENEKGQAAKDSV